jgi:hypothetical protein
MAIVTLQVRPGLKTKKAPVVGAPEEQHEWRLSFQVRVALSGKAVLAVYETDGILPLP